MLKNTGERLILDQSWNLMTTMEHLHRYKVAATLAEGKIVLDAACGTGYGTRMLAEKAKSAIGIDSNEDAIIYAKEKYGPGMENLDFRQMSIEALSFPDSSFDLITSFETIEHINQPQQIAFLESTVRMLKKDGILLISTPNDKLMREISRGNYTNPYHVTEFTEESFLSFLRKYFSYVTVYYQTVTEVSSIVSKGQIDHDGKFYPLVPENKMGRYYIAVCANMYPDTEPVLKSVCLPDPREYMDERYLSKTARVFVDMGQGFTGDDICTCNYISRDGREFFCTFDLSSFEGAQSLCFDPCEHGGKIRISSIEGDVSKITIRPLNASRQEQGYDIFETIDPIYIIETPDGTVPKKLTICGEIVETDNHEIFSLIEGKLNSTQNENYRLQTIIHIREEELSNTHKELIAIREYNSQLVAERDRTVKELTAIHDYNSQLIAERDKAVAEKNEAIKKCEELSKDILYLKGECARRDERINQLLYSTSWRITKPLRVLGDFGRMILRFVRRHREDHHTTSAGRTTHAGVKFFLKNIDRFLQKHMGILYNITFAQIKSKLRQHILSKEIRRGRLSEEITQDYWTGEKPIPHEGFPLVSVIVPNYNHSAYLRERLDTVYGQDYPNFEVILLDDHSTDNSVEILREYADRYPEKTTTCFNDENVGMVFRQWNKGISLAKGEYIWIAESDDYSSLDFLSKMVPLFEYQSVQLAFARSVFIKEGRQVWSTEEYLADLSELKWERPFMMTAHMIVNKGFAIKNIIPNVSSMMFRNIGKIPDDVVKIWSKVKLVGDWIFYLSIMRGGTISYTNQVTNYYRVHKESTSLKIQKTMTYYDEFQIVSDYVAEHYKVDYALFDRVLKDLEEHYRAIHNTQNASAVRDHYSHERARQAGSRRTPNIIMCCFSMKMGGGETYPIYLANEMKRSGAQITLLDFALDIYDPKVRGLLNKDVPLVELESPSVLLRMLYHLGAEIIHSHHGSVDNIIGMWLDREKSFCKHIISLHGMYESIPKADLNYLLDNVAKSCAQFIYTADKNLIPFKNRKDIDLTAFIKMGNGLPRYPITPVSREEMGIEKNAFVLCLVSRALEDKGWDEAIQAIDLANRYCKRPVHLILIGDGVAAEDLKKKCPPRVHYLGIRADIRNYFAISDMGFLPSRFRGESFPLVIIDSLMCGKPVLASDIGEIRSMVTLPDGRMAGVLFPLNNWTIDIQSLGAEIIRLAEDKDYYKGICANVEEVAEKFDISKVSLKYMEIYQKVLEKRNEGNIR